jgi:RND superfamily putative drug exporter
VASCPGVLEAAFLVGIPPDSWDAIDAVAFWFPLIMGLSCAVVVAAVGLVFRSVLIALRSVLTLAITVCCVFGLASLVYDKGALDFLSFPGLAGQNGLTWLVPVVCFSIVIGLSLDYDVLLLTRVFEIRSSGYALQDSIRLAQHKTGKVISVAGLIMAVAFSGLVFSSSAALNEMGFILAVAVLLDTFLFRAFLVPSLMSLLGEANFWPGRQPPPSRTLQPPSPWCTCRRRRIKPEYSALN